MLARFGLAGFAPLRLWADAVCQITVQCAADAAEAPFALAALDYFYRGTGHVRGGVGALARSAVALARAHGADVVLANRVAGVTRDRGGWFEVDTRRGSSGLVRSSRTSFGRRGARLRACPVAARPRPLARLGSKVASGWGPMLYLGLEAEGLRPEPHHRSSSTTPRRRSSRATTCSVSRGGRGGDGPRASRCTSRDGVHPRSLPGAGSGRPHRCRRRTRPT